MRELIQSPITNVGGGSESASQTENLKETPTDVEQGHPVFSERWVSLFNIGP